MANSETSICNMALNRIGSKRINSLTDGSGGAIACTLHYEQTRDALLRSHRWRFASTRATLSQDTVDPEGDEFDNQFIIPSDFMALKSIFELTGKAYENTDFTFSMEGQRLLTNCDSVDIRYVKKVTDPTEFDSLFVEVLVLTLAKKLVGSMAGANAKLNEGLTNELRLLMPSVRAMDRNETQGIGRNSNRTWVDVKQQGGAWRQPSR